MDEISAKAIASKTNEDNFYSFAIENRRFIKKSAFRVCHRLINESEDEWSIALIAFYEAVRSYDESKGAFKSFAALVIRRRLMDYFDKESAHRELAFDPYTFDGRLDKEEASAVELEVAGKAAEGSALGRPSTSSLQDEVESLKQRIGRYGFELFEIGGCSPKAKKTKKACALVIERLKNDDELYLGMVKKCNLPYTRLLEIDGVTKKLLERHRKYLIAAVEIVRGDYPQMAKYISQVEN